MIETERLVIRPLEGEDREELLAIWQDPANDRVTTTDEARIRWWLEHVWGVWERETGELVGDCSLHFDETYQDWELSYGFRRDRWGKGYASEAAAAQVRHGFESMGLERIVADVDPGNRASARVLEKCGFVRERTLEDGRFSYALEVTA